MLIKAFQEVLPFDGILQLAQGDGNVGAQLVSHPDINMIAMTGSSATGNKILQSAVEASSKTKTMKRIILEMGGKDPMIVFEDADLHKAASDSVEYSLCNTGQVCCSIERIYVAESIYEKYQSLVKDIVKDYKVGNSLVDPTVKVGPLVSCMQRDHVKTHVDDAIAKGAKVLYQSEIPVSESSSSSFYPVTVLTDVTDDMLVFTNETFGPVVAITKFDGTEATAITVANNTEYGLASCVYTQNLDKAQRIASKINAGQVGINCYSLDGMDVHCPWYVTVCIVLLRLGDLCGLCYVGK